MPGGKAAYCASKQDDLAGRVAARQADKGPIRITVVEPSYIESEMTAKSAAPC